MSVCRKGGSWLKLPDGSLVPNDGTAKVGERGAPSEREKTPVTPDTSGEPVDDENKED